MKNRSWLLAVPVLLLLLVAFGSRALIELVDHPHLDLRQPHVVAEREDPCTWFVSPSL